MQHYANMEVWRENFQKSHWMLSSHFRSQHLTHYSVANDTNPPTIFLIYLIYPMHYIDFFYMYIIIHVYYITLI